MTKPQNLNIKTAIESFRQSAKNEADRQYVKFLEELTTQECLCYFRIEARRNNEMIKALLNIDDPDFTVLKLKEDSYKSRLPMGHIGGDQAVKSLIEFWELFGESEKPGREIVESVIVKYEKHISLLTAEEKTFFETC